jgi:hypothetical protein
MEIIKDNIDFLNAFATLSPKLVKALAINATDSQILSIVAVTTNVVGKVLRLHHKYKVQLQPSKSVIRNLTSDKLTDSSRRDLIVKKAKVFSILVKAVLKQLHSIT